MTYEREFSRVREEAERNWDIIVRPSLSPIRDGTEFVLQTPDKNFVVTIDNECLPQIGTEEIDTIAWLLEESWREYWDKRAEARARHDHLSGLSDLANIAL